METDRQIGGGRGDAWEATAKSAMTGKTHGKSLKSWQWPGKRFFACLRKEA